MRLMIVLSAFLSLSSAFAGDFTKEQNKECKALWGISCQQYLSTMTKEEHAKALSTKEYEANCLELHGVSCLEVENAVFNIPNKERRKIELLLELLEAEADL